MGNELSKAEEVGNKLLEFLEKRSAENAAIIYHLFVSIFECI